MTKLLWLLLLPVLAQAQIVGRSAFYTPTTAAAPSFTDPTSIAGLNLWLTSADTTTLTYDGALAVSQWNDKSANAYQAENVTGNKPTFSRNKQNGLPMVYFLNSRLDSAGASVSSLTIFLVWKNGDLDINGGYFISVSTTYGNQLWINNSNGRLALAYKNYGDIALGTLTNNLDAANTTYLSCCTFSNATGAYAFYRNGAADGTGTVGGVPLTYTSDNRVIGSLNALYRAYIGEIIIYDSVLSTSDRQAVETYLNNKWAIY